MSQKHFGQAVAAIAVGIAFVIPWIVGIMTIVGRILD